MKFVLRNILYKEKLDTISYHVDKEELLPGIRKAIKILNEGEIATMDWLQKRLLERGVYFPGYGLGCFNLATTDSDVAFFIESMAGALEGLPPEKDPAK